MYSTNPNSPNQTIPTFQSIQVTVAPTFEPLTAAEAREFCRIDDDSQDGTLDLCIKSARERIENDTSRSLVTQTLRMTLDAFPNSCDDRYESNERDEGSEDAIIVPRPPLVSVSSITYVDTSGATQTLSTAAYTVDTYSEPGRIVPAYGYSWPSTRDVPNAVTITFVAGYTATTLPARAKLLCGLLTHYEFDQRNPVNIGNIVNEMPLAVKTLMGQLGWGSYS